MINVKQVNTIMTTSYAVIRHHLRSLILEACEGLRPFVITTKDNHLACMDYIIVDTNYCFDYS